MAEQYLAPGHTACLGCGEVLAARLVMQVAGPNAIVTTSTGCLEVTTSRYPESAWRVPWIHSLFENPSAVASGIEAALKAFGRKQGTTVIAQGGDGAMADIGFGALSGALERGHDVLHICYDNEAYMNTGVQRSAMTAFKAHTTTSPSGKESFGNPTRKKDMAQIAAAHGAPYVATTSVGYPRDLERKVKKAITIEGPKFMLIHVPCPLGWGCDPSLTIEVAKLAHQTGLIPIYEMEDGVVTRVMTVREPKPVEEYLKTQARFRHLFRSDDGKAEIARIQAVADENIKKYGIVADKGGEA
jgi:pyruvate ferredoxin oxidoreductase beta subunit